MIEQRVCYSPDGGGGSSSEGSKDNGYDLLIGTSRYRLSPETLQYLYPTVHSNWEASSSVVIAQEPHQSTEGQFSLFKGLESFFVDNPSLVKSSIFLAEGYPSGEKISLKPLIDIDPNPSENIIREVLRTYLVPGYLAYEWKYKQGIPVVGIEDPWLYKMCRTYLVNDERKKDTVYMTMDDISYYARDFWYFSVVARNKSMTEALLHYMQEYTNPMLFVGGLHLHMMDTFRFNRLQRMAEYLSGPLFKNDAANAQNTGIAETLFHQGVNFTFLKTKYEESKEEERRYDRLFSVQHGDDWFPLFSDDDSDPDYLEYIQRLFGEDISLQDVSPNLDDSNLEWLFKRRFEDLFPSISKKRNNDQDTKVSTTIRPSPMAASQYIYEWSEQRKSQSPNWFMSPSEEVEATLQRGSLWTEKGINPRGHDFEKIRRANLGSNCDVIDDYVLQARTVTSMKTLDLSLSSYQTAKGIESRIRPFIDELGEFDRLDWKDIHLVRGRDFDDRYLEIGIPADRATPTQVEKLLELQEYAQTKDVTLAIVEVP